RAAGRPQGPELLDRGLGGATERHHLDGPADRDARRIPDERVELALDDDDPAIPGDRLAGEAHAEETPALDGPAEPERVQDGLLPEARRPALEPGDALGIVVHEEERMGRQVPGEEPVLPQQTGGEARGAELGADRSGIGPGPER